MVRVLSQVTRHHLATREVVWEDSEMVVKGSKAFARRVERRHRNSAADVDRALYWMGRASDHEAGNFTQGGRGAQATLAVACAGIISNEVAVIHAEEMERVEREQASSSKGAR